MPLRAAILGTGFIGPVHLEAIRRAGGTVVGLLGSSRERSRAAADRFGVPKAYDSLADVCADAEVDVVHITTPNHCHAREVLALIAAGKHVLCEKPLGMTSRETAELVRAASASAVVCGVNYNIRFYPLCHQMRAEIGSGRLGTVWHVAGAYTQDWLLKPTDFNWRVLTEESGPLRAIADIGTHWFDLMQFVLDDEVVSVCADLQTVHAIRQRPVGSVQTFSGDTAATTQPVAITTDDAGAVLFRLRSGARGVMQVSQVMAGRKNCLQLEIAGSERSLAWNSESPDQLWVGQRSVANQSLLRDPALLDPAAAAIASYPGGHGEGFSETFKQLIATFYRTIATPPSERPAQLPFPTFADGHREVLLCEAILRSHQERSWIDVPAR